MCICMRATGVGARKEHVRANLMLGEGKNILALFSKNGYNFTVILAFTLDFLDFRQSTSHIFM